MLSNPPMFPIGSRPSIGEIADWCEVAALSSTVAFKRGDLKSAILLEDIENADAVEQQAWYELGRRQELFAERWPLRLIESRLRRRSPAPVSLPLYRFLALLSFAPLDATDRTLFELVVAQLVLPFTGRAALHLGAPASQGMDPSFRQRVRQYVDEAGLLKAEVKAVPLPDDKDLGLDAATWRSFSDNRGVGLHFVVQCATGEWEDKLHDIDLEVWKDHLHWGVPPVRVFAVPFVLDLPEAKWVRVARKGGLILDRPRLVELATEAPLDPDLVKRLSGRVGTLTAA